MSYYADVFDEAMSVINGRREEALAQAEERSRLVRKRIPEYASIEKEIGKTSILITRQMLSGTGDIQSALEAIKNNNLAQQEKLRSLLVQNGLGVGYPDPVFFCNECNDTGFVDGKVCNCLKTELKRVRYRRLNAVSPLKLCTFESFKTDMYPDDAEQRGISPRRLMEHVYDKCVEYAEHFSLDSPSLLLQGGVGLGKTHLSLAIAGKAIEKGYCALYGSAQSFLGKIEDEHFNRSSSGEDTLELCKSCDLLILDDLGVEFATTFTVAALHDIVDTRLLTGRPTIISTNLNPAELEKRYTERFTSRVFGSYKRCQFVGKDVRIKLRKSKKEQ